MEGEKEYGSKKRERESRVCRSATVQLRVSAHVHRCTHQINTHSPLFSLHLDRYTYNTLSLGGQRSLLDWVRSHCVRYGSVRREGEEGHEVGEGRRKEEEDARQEEEDKKEAHANLYATQESGKEQEKTKTTKDREEEENDEKKEEEEENDVLVRNQSMLQEEDTWIELSTQHPSTSSSSSSTSSSSSSSASSSSSSLVYTNTTSSFSSSCCDNNNQGCNDNNTHNPCHGAPSCTNDTIHTNSNSNGQNSKGLMGDFSRAFSLGASATLELIEAFDAHPTLMDLKITLFSYGVDEEDEEKKKTGRDQQQQQEGETGRKECEDTIGGADTTKKKKKEEREKEEGKNAEGMNSRVVYSQDESSSPATTTTTTTTMKATTTTKLVGGTITVEPSSTVLEKVLARSLLFAQHKKVAYIIALASGYYDEQGPRESSLMPDLGRLIAQYL